MPSPLRDDDLPPDAAEPAERSDASLPSAESALVSAVRAGDEAAFEQLFRRYYNPLCVFVTRYVGDPSLAEEMVDAVFARIWEQRTRWEVRTGLASYLYAAARYQVLDWRRHAAVEGRVRERAIAEGTSPGQGRSPDQHQACEAAELEAAIREAIEHLPERCRLIFTLRWQHHLSYAEIATTLGIATKTVETQINRALKALRERLRPFWG
jgi:RNA polymerase sigma-70 factor (ECF subfamily)